MGQQWEEFTQKSNYRAERLRVSLNSRGQFLLNQKAFDSLGSPESVVFLFDRSKRSIGIRASRPDVEHSYDVKRQGSSQSYLIRAKSFLNYFGVDIGDTVVFNDVQIDDEVIVLELNNITELVRRARLAEFPVRISQRVTPMQPAKFTTLLKMRAPDED